MNDLPQLTGSEKQIAWAEDIRERLVPELLEVRKKYSEARNSSELGDTIVAGIDAILGVTSAKWWIDHRNDSIGGPWVIMTAKRIGTK